MIYDQEKRIFLVKKFFELKSIVRVQRAFRTKYKNHKAPMGFTIINMVRNFEKTGQTSRLSLRQRIKTVRTEELIENLKNVVLDDPGISLTKAANIVPASRSTVRFVLREDLNLKPYKKKKSFRLLKADLGKRLEFANWVLNTRLNLQKWFICSDEAYFYLSGGHNIQNDRIWAEFQPNEILEQPLFDQKIMVWCAFSAGYVYGPYFFTETVKWGNYLAMLKTFFWNIHSHVKNHQSYYFQQDGAPPHRKKEVQDWLKSKFGDKFIEASRWPPRSPDLNPCDFSLWGEMKARVYDPKPTNLDQLRKNIEREFEIFKKKDLNSIFANLKKRLDLVIQENGGYIEHLL